MTLKASKTHKQHCCFNCFTRGFSVCCHESTGECFLQGTDVARVLLSWQPSYSTAAECSTMHCEERPFHCSDWVCPSLDQRSHQPRDNTFMGILQVQRQAPECSFERWQSEQSKWNEHVLCKLTHEKELISVLLPFFSSRVTTTSSVSSCYSCFTSSRIVAKFNGFGYLSNFITCGFCLYTFYQSK